MTCEKCGEYVSIVSMKCTVCGEDYNKDEGEEKVIVCNDDMVDGFEYALRQLGIEVKDVSWDDEGYKATYTVLIK